MTVVEGSSCAVGVSRYDATGIEADDDMSKVDYR